MKLLSLIVPSKVQFDNSIQKILKSPGYNQLNNGFTDFISNIKNQLQQWFLKLLKKMFNNLETASSVSDSLSTIFIIIGIMAIIAIILVIVLKINKTFEKKRKVKEILGERIDDKTTPNSLRQKARIFIESDDYRQAIRYDFIALLLLMHKYSVIYLDETKTNEEIYRYLRKNEFPKTEGFRYLIDSFNAAWYGHKEYSKEAYNQWNSYIESIWNEVTRNESKEK